MRSMPDLSATIERAYEIHRQCKAKYPLPEVVVAAIVLADILVPCIEVAAEKISERLAWAGQAGVH